MHPSPVIILMLTISLCDKNSLHNRILYILHIAIGLTTDSPVGKHQRKLVSQVKVKLNPVKFSKFPAVHVKITDGTEEPINQSEVM